MNLLKKAAKIYTGRQLAGSMDQEKIQETIIKSKRAFLENESCHLLTRYEFIYEQSFYIKKRWWLLQGLLLLFLYWLLQISNSAPYIQRCMGILSSLFVVLIIPESWKNCMNASTEIEGAAYYSLRQIYAARMFLFGAVDLLLLSIFFLTVGIRGQLSVGEMMISFFLPFMVSCCICFRSLCCQKAASEYIAMLICGVFTFIWVQIVLNDTVYSAITPTAWCIAMILSIVYFIYSINKLWKSCQTIWEVKPTWN